MNIIWKWLLNLLKCDNRAVRRHAKVQKGAASEVIGMIWILLNKKVGQMFIFLQWMCKSDLELMMDMSAITYPLIWYDRYITTNDYLATIYHLMEDSVMVLIPDIH